MLCNWCACNDGYPEKNEGLPEFPERRPCMTLDYAVLGFPRPGAPVVVLLAILRRRCSGRVATHLRPALVLQVMVARIPYSICLKR